MRRYKYRNYGTVDLELTSGHSKSTGNTLNLDDPVQTFYCEEKSGRTDLDFSIKVTACPYGIELEPISTHNNSIQIDSDEFDEDSIFLVFCEAVDNRDRVYGSIIK